MALHKSQAEMNAIVSLANVSSLARTLKALEKKILLFFDSFIHSFCIMTQTCIMRGLLRPGLDSGIHFFEDLEHTVLCV